MADDSRNPDDNVNAKDLDRALAKGKPQLDALERGINEVGQNVKETGRKAEIRDTKAERTRKKALDAGKKSVGGTRSGSDPTPSSAKKVADEGTRSTEAANEQTKAVKEQVRAHSTLGTQYKRSRSDIENDIRSQQKLTAEYVKQNKLKAPNQSSVVRGHNAELARLRRELAAPENNPNRLLGAGPQTPFSYLRDRPAGGSPSDLPYRLPRASSPPPPPPPPPRPPTASPGDDFRGHIGGQRPGGAGEVKELTEAEKTLDRARKQAALGSAAEREALQSTTRAVGLSGDQFRRHGALTTEFISAAAKGQVTIRELGFQVGSTIGKFAGWTAAASAVYGAVAAISKLGTGAVASLDGVAQLSRVVTGINTDQAQQSFRDLAVEFNLPISTVTEAAYEAGRVFKNQDDIFAATRTTLGAVAVAELTAGQAGQYLNAIYRGLGGTAQDLAGTLDAANSITNKFGGNTGQLVEGTAKAAASFKAASKQGEGYVELLSLVNTIQRATGISGAQAGTIIKRGAQNSQKPANREALKGLLPGVTDKTSFEELIVRAQEEFLKKGTTAARKGEIAKQIFTPNLAAAGGQALLQSPKLLQENLKAASAEGRKDSVKNEVEKKLTSITEQAKKLGIALEALGSAFATSGALDGAGLLLKALLETLHLAKDIVEIFDQLPAPVRSAVSLLVEAALVLKLLRRFNVGEALVGRLPTTGGFLSRNPVALERAQALSGIGQHKAAIVERSQSVNKRVLDSQFQLVEAKERAARAIGDHDRAPSDAGVAEVERTQGHVNRLETQVKDQKDEAADLSKQHAQIIKTENDVDRDTNRRRRLTIDQQNAVLHEHGLAVTNPTLDQRTHLRPVPIGGTAGAPAGGGVVPGTGVVIPPIIPGGPGAVAAAEAKRAAAAQNSLRNQIQAGVRAQQNLGVSNQTLAKTVGAAKGAATFGATAARSAATGLRALGSSLVASIGPLDALIGSLLVAYTAYNYVKEKVAESDAKIGQLNATGNRTAKQLRDSANKELKQKSLFERVQNSFASGINSGPLGALIPGDYKSPDQREDEAARKRVQTANQLARSSKSGVDLTDKDIRDRLTKGLRGSNLKGIAKAEDEAEREAGVGRTAIRGSGQKSIEAMQNLKLFIKNAAQEARAIAGVAQGVVPKDLKGLETFTGQTLPSNIGLDGFHPKDTAQAAEAIANARKVAAKSKSPEERSKALSVIQQAESTILTEAQERLERSVKAAKNPKEQATARAAFASIVRQTYTGKDKEKGEDLIREEARKQLEAELAAAEAHTARQKSATADPVKQARLAATSSAAKLRKVKAAYKAGLVGIDVLDNAAAANNEALKAVSDANIARGEAQRNLSASQFSLTHFTDQGAVLQNALGNAQAAASAIEAEGSKQSPETLLNALASVNAAKQAIAEFARSQAQELLSATAELAKSRTDDPIKQAEIDVQLARDQEKYATTEAERRSAKANTNNALKAKRDAKLSDKIDTIDFNLEFEKISREEAIRQYESLLKSAKYTKQQRRDILRKIKALKEGTDGELDLELGDIKLPTAYEVRRAINGAVTSAKGGAPALSNRDVASLNSTSNNGGNTVNINVNGPQDYDELGRILEQHVGGTAKGMARAGLMR